MTASFGSRTLIAICAVFVLLLAALAAVQYRWSTRVAEADAQREREHLEAAASLFTNEFNSIVAKGTQYLQTDAWAAVQSGERLAALPKPWAELYYLDVPVDGVRHVRRLTADGLFVTTP